MVANDRENRVKSGNFRQAAKIRENQGFFLAKSEFETRVRSALRRQSAVKLGCQRVREVKEKGQIKDDTVRECQGKTIQKVRESQGSSILNSFNNPGSNRQTLSRIFSPIRSQNFCKISLSLAS